MKLYFSVPYSVDLTNEKSWDPLDDRRTVYFVSRLHFMIESIQLNRLHKIGEKLAVFQAPKDASQEQVKTVTFERETIKIVDSIHKSLWESKEVAKFVSQLTSKLKYAKLAEISSFIKGELTSELRQSFSNSFKIEEKSIVRESISFEMRNSLGPSIDKPVVAVPVYQQCAYDIYLAYVDYILVKYQKKYFGLRKYRRSHPRVTGDKHKNRIRFGLPLGRILYWKHLDQSSKLVYEDEYKLQVEDPDEVKIVSTKRTSPRAVNFPKVPTLYQITRAAFPVKWKDRDDNDWTEEQLMQLEYDEAIDSPWWYRHGPGRISRK